MNLKKELYGPCISHKGSFEKALECKKYSCELYELRGFEKDIENEVKNFIKKYIGNFINETCFQCENDCELDIARCKDSECVCYPHRPIKFR